MSDFDFDFDEVPRFRKDAFQAVHFFRELASQEDGRNNRVVDWVSFPDRGLAAVEEAVAQIRASVDRGETPGAQVAWLAEVAVAWTEEHCRSVYAESEAGFETSNMAMCPNLRPAAAEEMRDIVDRNFPTETCGGCDLCKGMVG